MLRHAISQACRCTSTSTSLPCKHAALITNRSYSRKTPPNSFPSTTASPTSSSSSYSYQPHVLINQTSQSKKGKECKWFEPLQPHSFKSWLPSSSTSSQTPPLTPDQTTNLLNSYLTTRGPRDVLGKFEDEYGQLLEIAKEREMPFLKAMVLEDLEFGGMGSRERGSLGLERFERRGKGEEGRETKGLSEIGAFQVTARQEEDVRPDSVRRRKFDLDQPGATIESPPSISQTTQDSTINSDLSPSQALSLLSQLTSSPSPSSLPPLTSSQLSQIWSHFSPSCDLQNSLSDFSTTLSLLHYLLSRPRPTSHLPLALEIFSSLVQVLPEDLIAPHPEAMQSDQAIQFVLLRTAVNAALSEDLHELALEISLSIGRLHEGLEAEMEGKKQDLRNLSKAVEGGLGGFKEERKGSYKPGKLASSKEGLEKIGRGLGLMREWIGLPSEENREMLQKMKGLVNGFMEESAERYRWDLIATHFQPWFSYFNTPGSPTRWSGLESHHLKFARYLSGLAPYSTYLPHSRLAQPELFSFFARTTHLQLREGNLSDRWTLEHKWDYLDLLVSSPGATKETLSLARRIVSHWIQTSPLSPCSQNPFILRSTTLLQLLRSSSSSTSSSEEKHLNFSRSLINHFIQSLISPHSPYSTPSVTPPKLDHYDLTTLAQAYTILGDKESVGQVYRKMLELKFLPDKRDVELVLSSRSGDSDGGVGFLRNVQAVGVKVGVEVLKGLMRGVVKEGKGDKVEGVMRFAREEMGLSTREIRELEELKFREWDGPRMSMRELIKFSKKELENLIMSEKGGLSVKKAMGYMRKASQTRNYGLSLKIYHIFLGSPSPQSTSSLSTLFHSTLTTLVDSFQHSKSALRPRILQTLASTIDQTLSLSPSTISGSQENLELTLRGLIKVGEVDAIVRLFEELGEVKVRSGTREMVVRWAVGMRGRERVRNGEGRIGEWAREVLKERG